MAKKKIAVIGAPSTGKSTFIHDVCHYYKMFSKENTSIYDVVDKKNLSPNDVTKPEVQKAFLEFYIGQVEKNYGKKKLFMEKSPIDALVQILWLNSKGFEGITDEFVSEMINKVRNSLRFYDLIFWAPFDPATMKLSDDQSADLAYIMEVDNIYRALFDQWKEQTGRFYPTQDCPVTIELLGDRKQRLQIFSLYFNQEGEFYGESDSLIADIADYTPEEIEQMKKEYTEVNKKRI